MAKFEVKNSEGKKVAGPSSPLRVYGIEPNIHVMHHIVKCQMASWRQGTSPLRAALRFPVAARSLGVRRAPAVPARGSIRAAQWRHGGVVFAPSPVPTLSV